MRSPEPSPLAEASLFHTELTAARAVVYARLEGLLASDGFSLGGTIVGPLSQVTQALAARHRLKDLGPGSSLLARAIIPDPCLWSPETPMTYRVQLELSRHGEVIAGEERSLALRGLVASGEQLIRNGKRWVLRGVTTSTSDCQDWPAWRESGAAMLAYQTPSDEVLQAAAEQGVLVITRMEGGFALLLDQLRTLAKRPAVTIVLLPADAELYPDFDLHQVAPNLLLGHLLPPQSTWKPVSWSDVVVAVVSDPARLPTRLVNCPLPVIALRPEEMPLSVEAARAACDRLQRDLAPYGQFAGYVV